MEPWQSWGIVAIIGVAAYVYYSQTGKPKRPQGKPPIVSVHLQRRDNKVREDSKAQRKRGEISGASDQGISDVAEGSSASVTVSGKNRDKKRKGEKKPPSSLAQSSTANVDYVSKAEVDRVHDGKDEVDNKDFARQLSELKTGTSLTKPANTNETKRARKQGKRNELQPGAVKGDAGKTNEAPPSKDLSTASSTTGADADDDLSPAMSPALGATQSAKVAGDVSDMLEAPAKGPSVLRLTEIAQPEAMRHPQPKKKAEEPETKKQRQNREKNEQKKAAREQAEKERRVLLEKQLRTAREAEGRPAKNGLGASKAPIANAWTKPGIGTEASAVVAMPEASGALLDTFDQTNGTAGNNPGRGGNGASRKEKVWEHALPSEEEQLRMLGEMGGDEGWNTVEKSGKAKKRATKIADNGEKAASTNGGGLVDDSNPIASDKGLDGNSNIYPSYKSDSSASKGQTTSRNNGVTSQKRKPFNGKADPAIWNLNNIHKHPDYDPEYPYALTGHPDDSDWAVV